MLKRKTIPRHQNLFEFCKEHKLPLIIEKGEHVFKKSYTKMHVENYTIREITNLGDCRTGKIYPDFAVDEDSLSKATKKMVDKIAGQWLCLEQEPVVRVPILSYNIDGYKDFDIVQGTKALNIYDWCELENLTLIISTGEHVNGDPYVRAELEGYGIVESHTRRGSALAAYVKGSEGEAMIVLVRSISERHIAPAYKKNGWDDVDETKKIKVPALYV